MPDPFVSAQIVRRKSVSLTDRETLAEITHRKKCAKHKGRNHWRNWERRQMAKAKADAAKKTQVSKTEKLKLYHMKVRAYWLGLRDDLPRMPA